MARILVTGGSGFIGSAMAQRLISLGHEVIITGCRTEQQVYNVRMLEPGLNGINWSALPALDVVFHQAANNDTLSQDIDEMMWANVRASGLLFNRCRELGCRHFIFASSTAVYGDSPAPYVEGDTPLAPLNAYAKSKAMLEERALEFAQDYGVKVVGLRYCNVYGPNEGHKGRRASMIYQMADRMRHGLRPRLFKNGEQKRDYIYVEDVVEANLAAWRYPDSGIFNCGSGTATTFLDLAILLNKALETDLAPMWIDNPHPQSYQNFTLCDMKKADTLLGYRPQINIEKGIELTVAALPHIHQ